MQVSDDKVSALKHLEWSVKSAEEVFQLNLEVQREVEHNTNLWN